MSTVLADITQALERALDAALTDPPISLPAERIAWPNVTYQPSPGALWVRVDHLHAPTLPASAGSNALTRRSGILQATIYSGEGKGLAEALEVAQQLSDAFKRGTVLTRNTTRVLIEHVSPGPYLKEPGWVVLPVSIDWLVYAQD